MCSMDRIENTNCSQLDFFREMQLTVNLSSHPACIRLRDGSFSHFNHLQRGGFLLSPVRSGFIKKLNEFKNALGFLTDVQIETLALYSFGASHNQISEVLNIAIGTSKNRVNRILAALPIRTREEVFYFLFASGMAFSFCKVVTELIGGRVNKLLNK